MADIFSPWQVGSLELPNRLVRSATWEGMAGRDGTPSHDLINLTADLAEGAVGLIITGYAYVRADGQSSPRQSGVHIDACVGPLTRVSDAVHKAGGKVALQIVHGGGQAKKSLCGAEPAGPSAIDHPGNGAAVRGLGFEEILQLIEDFAWAAARAKAAGFDAVQLHGAHGYLINQFLSPNTNQRSDQFGGSLENRARFCLEVLRAVRDAVGPDFPVLIKLNSEDALADGLQLADSLQVASWLSEEGIDGIEVSGGVRAAGKNSPSRAVQGPGQEGYFLDNARRIKEVVDCPVVVVGGFRSPEVIAKALDQVDAVAMCRPFIREPHLARRWQDGDLSPARCISCGKCFIVAAREGVACGAERLEASA